MPFDTLLQKIEGAIRKLPQFELQVLKELEPEIVDLNVEQLSKGVSSEDEPMRPEYQSSAYATFKKSIGSKAPLGTPDLILEGDFTGAFNVEIRGDQALLDSRDSKTPELEAKYENIFGLTKTSREKVSQMAVDLLTNLVENEILI